MATSAPYAGADPGPAPAVPKGVHVNGGVWLSPINLAGARVRATHSL